jgi:hypothetical protein
MMSMIFFISPNCLCPHLSVDAAVPCAWQHVLRLTAMCAVEVLYKPKDQLGVPKVVND